MSYTVRWLGRYSEQLDDRDRAFAYAKMVLGTCRDWNAKARQLYDLVIVVDETERVLLELSAKAEIKRITENEKIKTQQEAAAKFKSRQQRKKGTP